jgi:superfamily I DNA/RNA helicase
MAYVQDALARKSSMTYPDLCRHARELLLAGQVPNPYDAVIVDESQDLGPQELLLLAALGGAGQDGLTLVGDGGQRIYGKRTSLKSLGIDVRGRSYVLRLNYRTTEQIRRFAERLIRQEADDLEGGHDDRRGVRNLLGGPQPLLRGFPTADAEHAFVVDEITGHIEAGRQPEDIAIFARKRDLLEPLKGRLHAAGLRYRLLTDRATASGVNLGTMHGAKGLEFKVVFVIDVSDDQMPQPKAYKGLTDPQARDEALRGEMQLLYVSVTRARDEAYLTWVGEKSRFLP